MATDFSTNGRQNDETAFTPQALGEQQSKHAANVRPKGQIEGIIDLTSQALPEHQAKYASNVQQNGQQAGAVYFADQDHHGRQPRQNHEIRLGGPHYECDIDFADHVDYGRHAQHTADVHAKTTPLLSEQDNSRMEMFWNGKPIDDDPPVQDALDFHGLFPGGMGGQNPFTLNEGDIDFSKLWSQSTDLSTPAVPLYHHQLAQQVDASAASGFDAVDRHAPDRSAHKTGNKQYAAQIDSEGDAASILQSLSSSSNNYNAYQSFAGVAWAGIGTSAAPSFDQYHSPIVSNGASSTATNTPLTPTAHTFQQSHVRRVLPQATHTPEFIDKSVAARPMQMSQAMRYGNYPTPVYADQQQHQPHHQHQYQQYQQQRRGLPGQNVPQDLAYGSDGEFRPSGFGGLAFDPIDEKSRNLTNVPLADAAARASRVNTSSGHYSGTHGQAQQAHQRTGPANDQRQHYNNAASSSTPYMQTPSTINQLDGNYYPQPDYNMASNAQHRLKRSLSQMEGASSINMPPMTASAARGTATRQTTELHTTERADSSADSSTLITPPGTSSEPVLKRHKPSVARADTMSSGGGSPSIPTTGAQAGSSSRRKRSGTQGTRPNLSSEQKRLNHIASEQKRRNTMKQDYEDLNALVPSLQQGQHGLSRSEVLQHAATYLQSMMTANEMVMEHYRIDKSNIRRLNGDALDTVEDEVDAEAAADQVTAGYS